MMIGSELFLLRVYDDNEQNCSGLAGQIPAGIKVEMCYNGINGVIITGFGVLFLSRDPHTQTEMIANPKMSSISASACSDDEVISAHYTESRFPILENGATLALCHIQVIVIMFSF